MQKAKKITRVKRFEMKPMFEEEAILQMELLKHDFFLFHNAAENKMCLLYKRSVGDYGMIISEQM